MERAHAVPDNITIGTADINFRQHTARKNNKSLDLTTREFEMLKLLAAANGEPVSRERFLDEVWEPDGWPTTRTVDNFIATLRRKLENDPAQPGFILTVRGVGYRLKLAD